MNNARFFLAFIMYLLIAPNIGAQKYFVKSYTIENGLPTRVVNDACQDSSGYMWFATYNGISSYDGFSFTNYDAAKGLPLQHYRKVKCDEMGILWGVPYRRSDTIVFFQRDEWKRIIPASGSSVEITAFDMNYSEGKPVLCIGSAAGIDIFQNSRWQHVNFSSDPLQNSILSVHSKDRLFYVLTNSGIYQVEQCKTGWNFKSFLKLPGEEILAINFEKRGMPDEKLWLLSSRRLSYLQNGKVVLHAEGFTLPAPPRLPTGSFLDLDNRGNVFFGNNWMKYVVSKSHGAASPLMVNNGFSSNGGTSVFVDREQNAWFTDTRGVDKLSNLLLLNYYEINGLLENEVTAIVELADGRMIMGHNNGLSIFDGCTFHRIPFTRATANLGRVLDLLQDREGNVWFAASNLGFGKLTAGGTIKWHTIDSTSLASSIRQDDHGRIWIGTNRKLFYLENDRLVAYALNGAIKSPCRKLFSAGKDGIVGTGMNGMFIISEDKVKSVPVAEDVKTQSIYAYYKSKAGVEFVGTLNGLCVIINGRIEKFRKDGIAIDNPVYFIFQDSTDIYWLGSNNGVIKWDGRSKFESFGLVNGLAGPETNRSAGVVDSRGRVWIGTDMGLSCFLPGFSNLRKTVPVMRLLDMEDNGGRFHPISADCEVDYTANTLFFHFRGISFVNEELILYRYKLDGYDRDWQLVDQSDLDKVKYVGVQPGKYRLVVQARNGKGEWSEAAQSGTITISTPVYRTWWFFLIIFLVVCLIVYGIIKIFLQHRYRLKLENEIAERMRSEKKTIQTLEKLHASEQKYHDLIEFAVDGFLMGSKEGVIIGANTCMQHLTGRAPGDLIGVRVDELFNRDDLNEVPLRYDLLERGETVVSHRNILKPDGTAIPVEMHTKMMPDGTYQSIYHDITQRKQLEDAIIASEEKFVKAFQNSPDPFAITRLRDGKYLDVNESYLCHSGYSREEMVGQDVTQISIWANPDDRKRYAGILMEHGRVINFETAYKTKSGEVRQCLASAGLMDISGEQCILAIIHDITERKLVEEALKVKASELERFNILMVGRELKMIELKKEINDLLVSIGQPEKYVVHE